MTKTVTKKQLLAAACSSDQEEMIKKYWPSGEQTVPIIRVVRVARGMGIPSEIIEILVADLDPEGWMEATQDIRADDAQVLHYLRREAEKMPEEPLRRWGEISGPKKTKYEARAARRPFVPKHWWDEASGLLPYQKEIMKNWWEGSFVKRLIEKGINPTYPFGGPRRLSTEKEYRQAYENDWSSVGKEEDVLKQPGSITEEDYRRLHERTWQGRTEEFRQTITTGNQETNIMSVTKTFTKMGLMSFVCFDTNRRLVEKHWPPGRHSLTIREIIIIARAIGTFDGSIAVLISELDLEGWAKAVGGIKNIHLRASGKVDLYLKWDEERILDEIRPASGDLGVVKTVPGNFEGVKMGPAPDALLSELDEFPFPMWPGNPPEPAPADITLKETVALIEKYKAGSDAPSKAIYLKLYHDGSGLLRDVGTKVYFTFRSLEKLEKKLKELTAPAVEDYSSLFYVRGDCLYADFSSIEITEENCLPLSLTKWQILRTETAKAGRPISNGGAQTCACCHLYIMKECRGCPIDEETGMSCGGTFVVDYCEAYNEGNPGRALIANLNEERFLEDLIARRARKKGE